MTANTKTTMRSFAASLIACLFLACSAQAQSLHILLTNDDGYDSAGLTALRDALRADGHRVTVVAPLGQRSGTGMKITLGEMGIRQHDEATWSVSTSPADAVSWALRSLLTEDRPDLVVSGANFGQNLGSNAFSSGTVGAAMMAVLIGTPAIAVSVGIDLAEMRDEPRFASTLAVFPDVAHYTAAFVRALAPTLAAGKLPPRHIVNINYPARRLAAVKGAVWVPASDHGGFELIYPADAEGGVKSWIEPDQKGMAETDTDTGRFAAGYVTLSWLSPDWNAGAAPALPTLATPADFLPQP